MTEETKPVFSGTFQECLAHLANALEKMVPDIRKRTQLRKKFLSYSKITQRVFDTARKETNMPTAPVVLRATPVLEQLGYKVENQFHFSQKTSNFCELISFGVLTWEQATDLTGYHHKQSVVDVLCGKENGSDKKRELFWDIWKSRREILEEKKEKFSKEFRQISNIIHQYSDSLETETSDVSEEKSFDKLLFPTLVNTVHDWTETAKLMDPQELKGLDASRVFEIASFWSHIASVMISQNKGGKHD